MAIKESIERAKVVTVKYDKFVYSIEIETDGFVYDRVIGDKKAYLAVLPLKFFVYNEPTIDGFDQPSFMVALDRVFIKVKKDGKVIRRFWQRQGRISFFLVVRNVLTREIVDRVPIGELEVRFVGFKPLDPKAMREARELAKKKKKLKEMLKTAVGKEKEKLEDEVKKLEEEIKKLVARGQPHAMIRLRVRGEVGDAKIDEEIVAGLYKAREIPEPFRRGPHNRWKILHVDTEDELSKILIGMKKMWEGEVSEVFTFYGNQGKMNHILKVLAKPIRKMEVEVLTEARGSVWRKVVKVKKNPVKIAEYVSKDKRKKVWVISPLKNMARFVIINKDHKFENLHRVMCHIKKGRYIVFIHEL